MTTLAPAEAKPETEPERTRQECASYLQRVPEEELNAALLFLKWLAGGRKGNLLLSLATAPWDDEPFTDEERAAVERARERFRAGRGIPFEEAWQRLVENDRPKQPHPKTRRNKS